MPYLLLDFVSEQDEIQRSGKDGSLRTKATGKGHFKLIAINTDKGEVVEIETDTINAVQSLRPPSFAEITAAQKVINKGVDSKALEAERDSWRGKALSAQEQIDGKDRLIEKLNKENKELRNRDFDDEARKVMADAIESRITELAYEQNFPAYEKAKKIYKQLTGQSWLDDDEEED